MQPNNVAHKMVETEMAFLPKSCNFFFSDNDIVPTTAPTYPTPGQTFGPPGRTPSPRPTPSPHPAKTTPLSRTYSSVAPSAGQAFTSRPFKRPERPPRWFRFWL